MFVTLALDTPNACGVILHKVGHKENTHGPAPFGPDRFWVARWRISTNLSVSVLSRGFLEIRTNTSDESWIHLTRKRSGREVRPSQTLDGIQQRRWCDDRTLAWICGTRANGVCLKCWQGCQALQPIRHIFLWNKGLRTWKKRLGILGERG